MVTWPLGVALAVAFVTGRAWMALMIRRTAWRRFGWQGMTPAP